MRKIAIRALHAFIILLAGLPWLVAYWSGMMGAWLVLLADKTWPEADWGNCWSFAGPKWLKEGGYIGMRLVKDVKLFGIFPVLHALWIRELPHDTILEMTRPLRRRSTSKVPWWRAYKNIPWWTFYFKFRIVYRDQSMSTEDSLRRRRSNDKEIRPSE